MDFDLCNYSLVNHRLVKGSPGAPHAASPPTKAFLHRGRLPLQCARFGVLVTTAARARRAGQLATCGRALARAGARRRAGCPRPPLFPWPFLRPGACVRVRACRGNTALRPPPPPPSMQRVLRPLRPRLLQSVLTNARTARPFRPCRPASHPPRFRPRDHCRSKLATHTPRGPSSANAGGQGTVANPHLSILPPPPTPPLPTCPALDRLLGAATPPLLSHPPSPPLASFPLSGWEVRPPPRSPAWRRAGRPTGGWRLAPPSPPPRPRGW